MPLQLLLKRLDQYAFSSEECERERAVRTVLALLHHFRALCTPGSCTLGCNGSCIHLRSTSDTGQSVVAGECYMFTYYRVSYIVGDSSTQTHHTGKGTDALNNAQAVLL